MMGKIKPMQVGYLYTNEEINRQRNELRMNEYCTSAEMATLRSKTKQMTAAESGEGFGVLWVMLWKLGDQLLLTGTQDANHPNNVYHVRWSYPITCLFDLQQFHVECKLRISRYARDDLVAVRQRGGDCEATFAAYRHADNANVPAFDHFACSEFKSEGTSLFVCWERASQCHFLSDLNGFIGTIKDLAVLELSDVSHTNFIPLFCSWSLAKFLIVDWDSLHNLQS